MIRAIREWIVSDLKNQPVGSLVLDSDPAFTCAKFVKFVEEEVKFLDGTVVLAINIKTVSLKRCGRNYPLWSLFSLTPLRGWVMTSGLKP